MNVILGICLLPILVRIFPAPARMKRLSGKESDMQEKTNLQESQETPPSFQNKKEWQEPKLSFVKPKLTKHGRLEEVTGQFFGGFTPPPASEPPKP